MNDKKIVVTGLGVFSAAGKNIPEFRESLLYGRSAIGPIDLFDVSGFPAKIGAQIRGFDPLQYLSASQAAKLCRTDQFAVIAAREALEESGVCNCYSPYDIGVSVGAGAAGMLQAEEWLQAGLEGRKAKPTLLRGLLPDRTSTAIARMFDLAGYQGSVTTACSSSATAIGWGADMIATGRLKAVLCGGADSLSNLTFAGFNSLRVVDPEPCAPFSLGRQGISLGEGAAFMILEDEVEAKKRGATIHGHILGYACGGEAFHMTAPEPSGESSARVVEAALKHAHIESKEIGWVNAHGTGTQFNDQVETKAMKLVFKERSPKVPLVSIKAMVGHCLGAAGAIEALATIIALKAGVVPQTLNFRGNDPECDLDYCHDGPKETSARFALSNSFAFGGNTTALVLGA